MDAQDFSPSNPDRKPMDPKVEDVVRGMARSLAITYHTDRPYSVGEIRAELVGFANLPFVTLPMVFAERDLSMFIPFARQTVFTWLAERGVDDSNVLVSPSVMRGRRRKFVDQNGSNRMGVEVDISFEMSRHLRAAMKWNGSCGTLEPLWKLGDGPAQA